MRRRFVPDTRMLALIAALLSTAAALLVPRMRLEREVLDVVAFVDITASMNTRDMGEGAAPESRLEAAKGALLRLIEDLPCRSRLGLGVFTERRVLLFLGPVDVCESFAPLAAAVSELDWRMAWEGDSYVTKGIHSAYGEAARLGAGLLFLTDGHEAPPLPPGSGLPDFEGDAGRVKGLIVGVGDRAKSPIPKFDDEGRETGTYGPGDVTQENRSGPPPKDAESRPGYHPKWAPFGSGPAQGDEHLTSVRTAHLEALAAQLGLAYMELKTAPELIDALDGHAAMRKVDVDVDLGPLLAATALAILTALYGLPLLHRAWLARLAAGHHKAFGASATKEKPE